MTNQTCKKCGFEIEPDDLIVVYGMPKHRDCFGVLVDRLEAAERRVAELEARLDTQEWHWGDEPPPPYDWYLVFDWDAEDLDFVAMQVVWFDGEWSCDLTHWRKLPEAPRAAWAEAHRCTSTPPPAATE